MAKPNPNPNVSQYIIDQVDNNVVPFLQEYIKIPNLSPDYDENCLTNGLQEKAMAHAVQWVEKNLPKGAKLTVYEKKGERTPFLHIEVQPFNVPENAVVRRAFLYQHFDKQPHMDGWEDGLGPTTPVIRNHPIYGGPLLYGRGGGDDGYALETSIIAINELQRRGIPHGHLDVVMEMAEESDSTDLEYWVDKLIKDKVLVDIDLVITLDSGCLEYMKALYNTVSLRGVGCVKITVECAKEAIHSGMGGGVSIDPTRILNILRARIEDPETGDVKIPSLKVKVPDHILEGLAALKEMPYEQYVAQFGFIDGVTPFSKDNIELALATSWKSSITMTGFDGCPSVATGGNVIRGSSSMKLSVRVPPLADVKQAVKEMREVLLANPPYGCKVTVDIEDFCEGWICPIPSPWLAKSFVRASNTVFGDNATAPRVLTLGGSIPFMQNLTKLFPEAKFVITGLLGPASNAHGPNEFCHIQMIKGIAGCVSILLEDHQNASRE